MEQGQTVRVQFDHFELDEADARLKRDGAPISLAPKAFAVLCTLAKQPGVLVTKAALLDAVWGHQHVSESVLKTTISEVRAALADDAKNPRFIETASRRGYRFIGRPQGAAPISRIEVRPSDADAAGNLFVGRGEALEELRKAWQRAGAGERQLIWIAGDAGVGKTTLIDTFVREIGADVVTLGQCVEHFGTGEPYLPILEAMKELCRRDPALVDMMRAVAPTWLVQMPWLINDAERAALHAQVAGVHQDRMVREMRELMDRFTVNRPLLFVLEDLHWSDQGTLRMMEHFARRPRQVRLMWVATFRLTQVIAEDHPLRELRQELRLHKLCHELRLEPFSETEVGQYLESRVPGTRLSEALIKRIHRHTEGLPLFLANVMDSLLAQAASAATDPDRWLAGNVEALPVPDSLAGVIDKQIGRLPADVRAVLEVASVCGVDFRAGTVAQLVGRDREWVGERCDELERRRFWLRHVDIVEKRDGTFDTQYAFQHALYRHVFYQRLSVPQRAQLHRSAARVLEEAKAAGEVVMAAELASHYERGHQVMSAVHAYTAAARHAFIHFAPREAFDLTTKGLQLLERLPAGMERDEAEILLVHARGLAVAQLTGVGSAESFECFVRTRQLCDALPETPDRALLLNGMGFSSYMKGDFAGALALADRVEAIGERHDDQALRMFACLLRGISFGVQGKHVESGETLERGLAIWKEHRDRIPFSAFVVDPGVAFRLYLTVPFMHRGFADQARAQVADAHARAAQTGQPSSQMLALWLEGTFEVRYQRVEYVANIVRKLREVVDKHMLPQGEGPAHWLHGWVLAHSGSPREGYRSIRKGFELHARQGMYANKTEVLGWAAEALVLDGDLAGAEAQFAEAMALGERLGERIEYTNMLLLGARIAGAQGDSSRQLHYLHAALTDARTRVLPYHELKALLALLDGGFATDADRARIKEVFGSLTEGFDLPVPARVAALLPTL